MTPQDKETILRLLAQHRIMTVATVRADGWPQATTVGYASEGLALYFLCGRQSQKAANIAADDRISLTIDHDTRDPMGIEGLSMAAHAYPIDDPAEEARVIELMVAKFPEYRSLPQPDLAGIQPFMVVPEVISVLDYRKGFGHSDLVTVTEADRGSKFGARIVHQALLRLSENASNWQLRPAPKFRNRHRPLPRPLHLQQAH
ncbi:pyridoxamine 5'-phosphate oxidase family protein [Methyloceanibacter sp.]|uniref:pyridoxamine 5'-phosphate oxidase family protein n=1 Tax=Methyloceanibacter sp. TaxID=1965321 RepID=UPI003D6CA4BA